MRDFIRKMYISAVVTSCIIFGFMGVCVAYSNIRNVAYGEYRNAIEIKNGKLYFFDIEKEIITNK